MCGCGQSSQKDNSYSCDSTHKHPSSETTRSIIFVTWTMHVWYMARVCALMHLRTVKRTKHRSIFLLMLLWPQQAPIYEQNLVQHTRVFEVNMYMQVHRHKCTLYIYANTLGVYIHIHTHTHVHTHIHVRISIYVHRGGTVRCIQASERIYKFACRCSYLRL